MAEDWLAIAAEVAGAIDDTGFVVQAARADRSTVTDPVAAESAPESPGTPYELSVIDSGIKMIYESESLIPTKAHILTVAAKGPVPAPGDTIQLPEGARRILKVNPLAPGGVNLLFDLTMAS